MGGSARAQRFEIVAALERGDETALAMPRRTGGELLGDPCVIALDQHELRQGVGTMRVESGGNQEEMGPKIVERRQDDLVEGAAELARAGARPERHIDDVADTGLVAPAGAGIEGIL